MAMPHPLTTPALAGEAAPRWGKSAALLWFAARLRSAYVPPSWVLPRWRWQRDGEASLQDCLRFLGSHPAAIRSDACIEDQLQSSWAGHFHTELEIPTHLVAAAVARVFAHMGHGPEDAVLIQPMQRNPLWTGVASTHRVHDGAPWYCVEMSRNGVAAVTDGRANGRIRAVQRDALHQEPTLLDRLPVELQPVLTTLLEIESKVADTPLEIEFALLGGGAQLQLCLLQIRPLATRRHWPTPDAVGVSGCLRQLEHIDPLPGVAGTQTALSLMSDWNPAELLGTHPRPLALSVFNRLIAHGVWWNARARLGYQAPPHRRVALLHAVAGRPYVDVRRSANSLLPAGLPPALRAQIVDDWLSALNRTPELHDKVEFAVYRTVHDFTAPESLRRHFQDRLDRSGFQAWQAALARLSKGLFRYGLNTQRTGRLARLQRAELTGSWSQKLRACRAGTEEFAILARLAFAAEAQLRSAVERDALSPERALQLRAASSSVASLHESLPNGHLRAGTFDITQPVWRPDCSRDADPLASGASSGTLPGFQLRPAEARRLNLLLNECAFPLDAAQWVSWIMHRTRDREWGKFVFSRHLSAALEQIAAEFTAIGLDRETASWLPLGDIEHGLGITNTQRECYWRTRADTLRAQHQAEALTVLSPLLRGETDGWYADSLGMLPNFVGQHAAAGAVVALESGGAPPLSELRGAIVVMSHADPGYDWLFEHGIRGLITAWGGAHSHMAIRCAEFGLAAAIGCGEAVYQRARQADRARIDPAVGGVWLE